MKGKLSSVKTTEKIVDLVRKYPQLYDQSRQDYRDAIVSANLWKDIAKTLEEDVSGEEVRTRWRSLRDNYMRLKRNNSKRKSGSAATRQNKWMFMNILSFLDPYIQDARDKGDLREISERPNSPKLDMPKPSSSRRSSDWPIKKKRQKVSKHSTFKASFLKIAKSQSARLGMHTQKQEERHPMGAFFESCAMRAKEMSKPKQAWLQLQVSALMYSAELSDCPSTPAMPASQNVPPQATVKRPTSEPATHYFSPTAEPQSKHGFEYVPPCTYTGFVRVTPASAPEASKTHPNSEDTVSAAMTALQ